MRNALVTAAIVAMSLVGLRADVTVVQTMTMEGAAAAALGGAMLPRITMHIKGQKARSDIEMNGQTISSIADIKARQIVLLNSANKTAMVMTPNSGPAVPMPEIDVTMKPTGKSQTIDGQTCDEHAMALTLNMSDVMPQGAQVPPEAAAMMADVKMVMKGSIWIAKAAPGASEFAAFNKAALESNLFAALSGAASGAGPLDKLMKAGAASPGLPYLTEMTMEFQGGGPMAEAMQQMGPMKMIQKISSVSTAPLADDLFTIPADYKVEKQ
ncbi:MAG TPA: hypothetical protein VGD94_17960 [Vicinamibacterales bacterium]